MLASVVALRPAQTAPKTPRQYDYVLDQKLLHLFHHRLVVPPTITRTQLSRQVCRDIRYTHLRNIKYHLQTNNAFCKCPASQLEHPDDVQLELRRPRLVRKLNVTETWRRATARQLTNAQPPDRPTAAVDGLSRMRLVHHQWRDLAQFPAFTQRLPDTVRTSCGRDVRLTVRLRCFPVGTVRWYKDNQPLSARQPDRVTVQQWGADLYALCIRQATVHDAGVYSCTVQNCAGEARTSAYVHVEPYRGPYLSVRTRECGWIAGGLWF